MGSGQGGPGIRAQQKSLPTESSHPPARPAATSRGGWQEAARGRAGNGELELRWASGLGVAGLPEEPLPLPNVAPSVGCPSNSRVFLISYL